MTSKHKITVEPLSLRIRGFIIDDLLHPEFVKHLRKELPVSNSFTIGIGFPGTQEFVYISHDRREDSIDFTRTDVEGSDPKGC